MATLESEIAEYADGEKLLLNDETAPAFAETLRDPQCDVVNLDFYRNELGDAGLAQIMASLAENNTVRSILIAINNPITQRGIDSIAQMLRANKSVETLHIVFFTPSLQCLSIFEAIDTNKKLLELFMNHICVYTAHLRRFSEIMENNFTLEYFYIDPHPSKNADYTSLNAICARNRSWSYDRETICTMCASMYEFQLPLYVLLEIFEWVQTKSSVSRWRQVEYIRKTLQTIEKQFSR